MNVLLSRLLRSLATTGCLVALVGCGSIPSTPESGGTMLGARATQERVVPKPDILSTESWDFGGTPGEVIRTTHYRIYTTSKDDVIKTRMAGFLEYAIAHYRTAMIPLPPPRTRLDTYLMDNRHQWEVLTKRLMGQAQSGQLTQINRGGFASRGIGVYYDLGLYDTLAIAAHEGWHQYTQKTFRDGLPVWLEEGLASFMEGHRWKQAVPEFRSWANLERYDALMHAVRQQRIQPLDELLESLPSDFLGQEETGILTYYAQVWALTHFLHEGAGGRYRASLDVLLQDAVSGELRRRLAERAGARAARDVMVSRKGSLVFEVYFNGDLEQAGREYDEFIESISVLGTRNSIAAGRSPIQPPTSP